MATTNSLDDGESGGSGGGGGEVEATELDRRRFVVWAAFDVVVVTESDAAVDSTIKAAELGATGKRAL